MNEDQEKALINRIDALIERMDSGKDPEPKDPEPKDPEPKAPEPTDREQNRKTIERFSKQLNRRKNINTKNQQP